ncbi:A disintegrin and metalloproteinase with thrombospondin motifs 16-like [Corticium candelabrum]|uniref:A disintegrin and metalloproteinase with thrombospondin motifs 16-like n=1 Tax=Corticium candelabrum TaxID=121492 RepID=UPI002E26E50C|nr:A disintegrin and metalloproteinase with thrombospondin motifs 16-like [Corticium candelabrum]
MLRWTVWSTLCCSIALFTVKAEFSKGFDAKWLEHADTDVAFPMLLQSDGGFSTSNLLPSGAERSKRGAGSTEKWSVSYRLNGFGVDYELQMTPSDELVSPSGLVQTIQESNMGEEVVTEYISDEGCHLNGWVRADEGSNITTWGRAAISVCDGNMTGVMKMRNYEVHIEVASEEETPAIFGRGHLLQRRSTARNALEGTYCHVTEADHVQESQRQSESPEHATGSRTKRQAPGNQILFVETLVTLDKAAIDNRKMNNRRLQNYVLSMLNIANMLWSNSATGYDVRFVVMRIMLLKKTPSNFTKSNRSVELLSTFCKWQSAINSPDDRLQSHHDYAILITGNELCASGAKFCGELGRAYLSATCSSRYACQVTSDTGVRTGFVVAHEMGHSFGMYHDGEGNNCTGALKKIMAAQVSTLTNLFQWSKCSQLYIHNHLKRSRRHYTCLLDSPPTNALEFDNRWSGTRYDLNAQCSFQVGKKTKVCSYSWARKRVCQALWCQEGNICTTVYIPALDGSPCGKDKVCVQGQCVLESEKENYTLPNAPIHGTWCNWTPASNCSRTCGGGLQYRTRACECPQPSNGGQVCDGLNYRMNLCNTLPCVSQSINPRVKLCREKTDSNGMPMEPYYKVNNTCNLLCYSTTTRKVVSMGVTIKSGAKCDPNSLSNDRCFLGVCAPFGCDNKWQSDARTDNCGVCQGTERSCRFRSGTFQNQITKAGYHSAIEIPYRASNVFVNETRVLKHLYLAVQVLSPSLRVYVLNGNDQPKTSWQRINAAGTVIEYSRPSYAHETIKIEGPLQQRVKIMVLSTKSKKSFRPNIKWQYSVPSGRDFGKGSRQFIWDTRLGPCSTSCSGGLRNVSFYCRSTTGWLEGDYRFCDPTATRPPKAYTVSCNTDVLCSTSSPVYNWRTGNWNLCSATCGPSLQKRKVYCYNNATSQTVDNYHCQDPAPSATQKCSVPACMQNGGWSEWKASGKCSKTCGSGVLLETRACDNPKPINGGRPCIGTNRRHSCCNTKLCQPTSINEFTAQCRKKYPGSKAVFSLADLISCEIKCQLPQGSTMTVDADDGTRCDLRSTSRCLNQACRQVGCDCVFDSTNTPSECGLCDNQSAKCVSIISRYRIQHYIARDYHILDVPKGAYRLRVHMKKGGNEVEAGIVMYSFGREKISSTDFRTSSVQRLFAFGGEVSYTHSSVLHEETMTFYGPTQEGLQIFMLLEKAGNPKSPTIDVSYVISNEYEEIVYKYNHPYGWRLAKTACSVTCGSKAGVEHWEAQCAVKNTGDYAEISKCSTDYKPHPVHNQPCQGSGNCPGFVWQVKPWKQCSSSCGVGQQTRAIRCISEATQLGKRSDLCDSTLKPYSVQECVRSNCGQLKTDAPTTSEPTAATTPSPLPYFWTAYNWKSCSTSCGRGTQVRAVRCVERATGLRKKVSLCDGTPMPIEKRECNAGPCQRTTSPPPTTSAPSRYVWSPQEWISRCSVTCGVGYEMRRVKCVDRRTGISKKVSHCNASSKPSERRECIARPCDLQHACTEEPADCPAIKSTGSCNKAKFASVCCKSCR